MNFDELEDEVWHAKVVTADGKRHHVVGLLGDGVTRVDPFDMIAADRAKAVERRGAVSKDLANRLIGLPADALVPIQILVKVPLFSPNKEELDDNPSLLESWMNEHDALMADSAAALVGWLDSQGIEFADPVREGPLLRVVLRRDLVDELSKQPDVALLDHDRPRTPMTATLWGESIALTRAQQLTAPFVPPHGSVRPIICLAEADLPADASNLAIDEVANPSGINTGTFAEHTQVVAGFLSNLLDTGVAPFAHVKLWNWNQVNYTSFYRWCGTRTAPLQAAGSAIVNFSWASTDTTLRRANAAEIADDYTQNSPPYMLLVFGAGNDAIVAGSAGSVQHRGAIVLVAGNADIHGTSSPVDDTIYPTSAWRNPVTAHGDRELPVISAPGSDSSHPQTTIAWGPGFHDRGNGTSVAAPIVSATAAHLIAADPQRYNHWPELLRATLVATALDNADSVLPMRLPHTQDARDGLGLLNAERAVEVALVANRATRFGWPQRRGHDRGYLSFASDFAASGYGRQWWNVRADVTGRLRVAIAFNSTARCGKKGCSGDEPLGDIDLLVEQVGGTKRCSSMSFDSTIEYCQLNVVAGEEFRVRLRLYHAEDSGTAFGIAWTNEP